MTLAGRSEVIAPGAAPAPTVSCAKAQGAAATAPISTADVSKATVFIAGLSPILETLGIEFGISDRVLH